MTASPTAIPPSHPKQTDGGNALAALFAAAAANSMHRQTSSPSTTKSASSSISLTPIENISNGNGNAAAMFASLASPSSKKQPQRNQQKSDISVTTATPGKDSDDSAAQLIARLLNGALKQEKLESSLSKSIENGSPSKNSNGTQNNNSILTESVQKSVTPKTQHLTKKAANSANKIVTKVSSTKVSMPVLQQTAKSTKVTSTTEPNNSVKLRNLETWHDGSEVPMDESCYQELIDSGNTDGWSADEMFRYNEKRHKVTSSYTEKTLGDKYTTPLPKNKSKTTIRMATKLAKEIEDRVQLEGRITPESSDDDEIYEKERARINQLKQLDQLRSLKAINSLSIYSQNGRFSNNYQQQYHHADLNGSSGGSSDGSNTSTRNGHETNYNKRRPVPIINHNSATNGRRVSNKSTSQDSNSSTTPVTASLSSSPTLNDSIGHHVIKLITSSSRNILRACLT